MKHGLFILVTATKDLLSQEFPGVFSPSDVSTALLSGVKAIIFDLRLPLEEKAQLETLCVASEVPFFYWSVPEHCTDKSAENFQMLVLQFITDQNAWRSPTPSPETLERLELKTLVDILTTANSHLQPEEVMRSVMERIQQIIPCEAWSVLILDNNAENTLSFAVAYGPGTPELQNHKVLFGQGIAGWVAKNRKPVIVNDVKDDPRFLDRIDKDTQFNTHNVLCAPLVSRGRTIGVLEMLNHREPGGFTEDELEIILTLVNPAAVAIENAYLFQKAQTLTTQDDLTKLFNARHLHQCLDTEIIRAKRTEEPLTLLFIDLDGFKSINDNYGHPQGSDSLKDIAKIIKGASREMDVVGRYGGDEFMLILPATDMEGAVAVGERIRNCIEGYHLGDIHITASIGIAAYPRHGQTRQELIRLADKAMYRVKEKGKNGILLAHDL